MGCLGAPEALDKTALLAQLINQSSPRSDSDSGSTTYCVT